MRRRRIEIASLWRQLAAGVVDAVIVLATLAGGIFGWVKLGPGDPRPDGGAPWFEPRRASASWRVVAGALKTVEAVELRNVRSPGARFLGIRRADARTGGPVSFRSALVQELVSALSSAVSRELTRPLRARGVERLRELEPAIKEIQRTHADNPEAAREATLGLYRDNNVNPFRGCWWPLVGPVAAILPALWSRRHQTLPDRLAGIIVVRE